MWSTGRIKIQVNHNILIGMMGHMLFLSCGGSMIHFSIDEVRLHKFDITDSFLISTGSHVEVTMVM